METDNLVLEHLRAIRSTLEEHGRRLAGIQVELASLGQQVGGVTTAVYSSKDDIEDLRRRVERLERRAGLVDGEH
jgi:tetrahydromethanopterin S-methyltransferase subunit G